MGIIYFEQLHRNQNYRELRNPDIIKMQQWKHFKWDHSERRPTFQAPGLWQIVSTQHYDDYIAASKVWLRTDFKANNYDN